ncbi:MAG TPA: NAD(P)H-dependent oxidoreductase [Bacillota bacterium]|nr:NAD(P)H-dependent oxidoreductase [Bacillota bacterium]
MRALLLNGAPEGESYLDSVERHLDALLTAAGWEVDRVALRESKIAGCRGCFGCWIHSPGICVIDDEAREVARLMVGADLLLGLTPVVFGGYSAELKQALDRSIGNILPFFVLQAGEVLHARRYPYAWRLAAVGVQARPDEGEADLFRRLVVRNARNFQCSMTGSAVLVESDRWEEVATELTGLLRQMGVGA